MLRKLKLSDIEITVTPLPEDISVRDCGFDPETVQMIQASFEQTIWAWCRVEVTCEFQGLSHTAHLGGCSYADEKSFREGGYFDDMVCDGLGELDRQVESLVSSLGGATVTL